MNGFVIVNRNFVKDLCDAKIYHTEKGANETANYQVEKADYLNL